MGPCASATPRPTRPSTMSMAASFSPPRHSSSTSGCRERAMRRSMPCLNRSAGLPSITPSSPMPASGSTGGEHACTRTRRPCAGPLVIGCLGSAAASVSKTTRRCGAGRPRGFARPFCAGPGMPIVRPLFLMGVMVALGRQIAAHVGIGVLLNGERRRGVTHEDGDNPLVGADRGEPTRNLRGDVDEALAARRHPGCLAR
jgi:hypothetical protein